MKSNTKVIMMIAAAIAVFGILMAGAAVCLAGFNFKRLETTDSQSLQKKEYSYRSDEITGMNIIGMDRDVKIVGTDADTIDIVTWEDESEYYDRKVSADGQLNIKFNRDESWFYHNIGFQFDFTDTAMIVSIPYELCNNITVTSSSGCISLNDIKVKDALTVTTAGGDVYFDKVTANNGMQLESNSGCFVLKDITCNKDILVKTISGDLELNTAFAEGNLGLEADSGCFMIKDATVNKDMSIKTSSGDAQIESASVQGNIESQADSGCRYFSKTETGGLADIHNTSGDIELNNFAATSYNIETSSGCVYGTLLGNEEDYNIKADTSNGEMDIPSNSNGKNAFSISTISGDVSLKFK